MLASSIKRTCQTFKTFLLDACQTQATWWWRSCLQRTWQLHTVLVLLCRYKLLRWNFIIYRVSLFAGIGTQIRFDVRFDSMSVVIYTSKCPTRLLELWPIMYLAATLLSLSKYTDWNFFANSMNDKYVHLYTLLTTEFVMVINKAHIKIIVLMKLLGLYCNYYYIYSYILHDLIS